MLPFLRPDLNEFSSYHTSSLGDAAASGAAQKAQKAQASQQPAPQQPAHYDQLDANECPYDLPAELKQKLAWQLEHEIRSNRYPAMEPGLLKQEIVAYVNESLPASTQGDANLSAANISVGNGSDEILRSLMIATCLGGVGSILIASPTFSMYRILAQSLGIAVVDAGRTETTLEIDVAKAQSLIDGRRDRSRPSSSGQPPVRAVFVVHPNSPTANALTPAEIDWLRQLPENLLVIVDEAYFEFSGQTLAAEVLQRPNWVITRTFSKAFRLAAYRVGYSIASPEMTAVLEKLRLPYNLPSVSQAAAQVALQNRQELLAAVPELLSERDRLHTALQTLAPLKLYPSQANFCFAQLRHNNTPAALEQVLARVKAQGTMIRHTGGGLRISVGTPHENQRLLERLGCSVSGL